VSFQRSVGEGNGAKIATADAPNLDILLVDTGVPRNTKELVQRVQERLKRVPKVINNK